MESSVRNSNRTDDRNDTAMIALSEKLPTPRHGFFYQYCNNSRCRQVTLLILPLPRQATEEEVDAFRSASRTSDIPAMLLEFPDEESIRATLIKGDHEVVRENLEWGTVLKWMHNKQVEHERSSSYSECSNYTHKPLAKGTWSSKNESTRFSNEVRSIPGVRHIDVDGIFHCPDCMVPLFAVEATSDGCPGTPMAHKHKATSMTRKIASLLHATPLLVQHHYDDSEHENPVYLTSWTSGRSRRFKRTWDVLVQDFEVALERHYTKECASREHTGE